MARISHRPAMSQVAINSRDQSSPRAAWSRKPRRCPACYSWPAQRLSALFRAFASVAGDGCQDTTEPGSGSQSRMVSTPSFPSEPLPSYTCALPDQRTLRDQRPQITVPPVRPPARVAELLPPMHGRSCMSWPWGDAYPGLRLDAVRSSWLPSESRPYSERGRSGSICATQNQADLLGRPDAGAGWATRPGAAHQLGTEFACVRSAFALWTRNTSANRLRCANAVNHGVPMIGAYPV